jgi:hypothetical protein
LDEAKELNIACEANAKKNLDGSCCSFHESRVDIRPDRTFDFWHFRSANLLQVKEGDIIIDRNAFHERVHSRSLSPL